MNKIVHISLVALAVVSAACKKVNVVPEPEKQIAVTAVLPQEALGLSNGESLKWEPGD